MTHSNPAIEQPAEARPSGKPFLAGWRRDVVVCLSLANVLFLMEWEDLFSFRRIIAIWTIRRIAPSPIDDAAVMTAVILLAAVLFGAVRLTRERLSEGRFRLVRYSAFGLVAIPLNGQRGNVKWLIGHLNPPLFGVIGPRTGLCLMALACVPLLWLAWKYQRRIAAFTTATLVVLSPFCLMTFSEAVWAMASYTGQPYHDGPLAPRLATAPPPVRVVWIVFDEWDYRLTFVDRPKSLAMPAIDRLRGESLFATAARSPFMDTSLSLPSLITGRRLEASINRSGSTILVAPVDRLEAQPKPWTEDTSIFAAVRKSGFNVGLVGWYFPYCRTLNGPLSECAWWPAPNESNGLRDNFLAGLMGTGFWGKVGGYSASLLERFGWHLGQYSSTRYKAKMYLEFLAESNRQVADPSLGLVFLHVPVPHYPNPYNRFTGRMDGRDLPIPAGYIDSLALTDRMMGELRATMESHGTWDHTALLISSDHPFRSSQDWDGKSDRRVPFLLRFPGRPNAAVVAPQFDTILSANLVYAILRGSVSTAAEASDWIERHRAERESPVGTEN